MYLITMTASQLDFGYILHRATLAEPWAGGEKGLIIYY